MYRQLILDIHPIRFYSPRRPHEFYSRKAVKQVERAFWQVIYRTQIYLIF